MSARRPAQPSDGQAARLENLLRLLRATRGATLARADDRDGALASMFTRRGVADLHALLTSEPALLRGALVADRVIGLGAAALMTAAGIAAFITPVISEAAAALFAASGIPGIAGEVVPYIINRSATGPCPLESRLQGVESLPDMLAEIDSFIAERQ